MSKGKRQSRKYCSSFYVWTLFSFYARALTLRKKAFRRLYSNKILLFCIFAYFPTPTSAQPNRITFEHITVEDGLAHNRVWRILQDSKGFLWFATGYGLSRYDGYKFINFRQGGPGTLSHDAVWAVFEDHAGTIWVGTYGGGLNKFDAATQAFRHFLHDPDDPNSLSNNVVRDIHEFPSEPGVLWIATIGGGLNRFDTRTETFTHFRHDPNAPESLPHNSVHALYASRNGELWLGTGNGFSRLIRSGGSRPDSKSISFHNYPFKPGKLSNLYDSGVAALLEGNDGMLWLGASSGGVSQFNREAETYVHYVHDRQNPKSLESGSIRSLFEDASGDIWIGIYGGGLNRFDRKTQAFMRYQQDPGDPNSLSHNVVRDILVDRSGVLWVATFGGGVNKGVRKKFILFRHEQNNPNSLRHNDVIFIQLDSRGSFWLGLRDAGLTRIDLGADGNYTYTDYTHDPNDPNSIGHNTVYRIRESQDQPGVFWFKTGNSSLERLDSGKNRIVRYKHDPDVPTSLSSNMIGNFQFSLLEKNIMWVAGQRGVLNRLHTGKGTSAKIDLNVRSDLTRIRESFDEPGVLWIGTNANGLIRYDSKIGVVEHVLEDGLVSGDPAHIERIYESQKNPGVLWVTTDSNGFYKIAYDELKNGWKIKHYKHEHNNPNSLANNELWAFRETEDGVLWFGSEKGLSKFEPENEKFTNYTTEDGLAGNFIYIMRPDDNGHIWMATNGGLARFDPSTVTFRNYDTSDGVQGAFFNPSAAAKGRDGTLFFGGLNGLNMFHPDSITDNPHIPPLVITDFQIFNKPVRIDPLKADDDQTLPAHFSTLDEIVLSYRENVFSFAFAALDYTAPEKNQYAYKLEGFHKDWIAAGANRTASFTNLAPGEYTFRVKGSNNDGVWNETGTSIKIIILPPWWRTWWAYSLYGLSFLLGLLLLWRYESNRQKHKHIAHLQRMEARKLQEVDYLKSTFFANISHEIRTPLTLIMGQVESELASKDEKKNRNKLQMALRNAKQLLRLINQLLDLSKLAAGGMTLNAKPGNIIPLLKSLTASFESLAQQKKIELKFDCAHHSIIANYEQDKIEKIMYNLLSNALKFTPEGGKVAVAIALAEPTPNPSQEGNRKSPLSGGDLGVGSVVSSDQSPTNPLNTDNCLLITVRDSGIGIPQDRLPHIFDRFYQVDSSQVREHEGTGIGLALTKELVELHGGTISVESAEGFGTTFVVQLPVASEDGGWRPENEGRREFREENTELLFEMSSGSEESITSSRSSVLPSASSDIILIIEDNADVRAYIRQTLENTCRLIEAKDGEDGFSKAQEYVPDLIISDVMMPKVDGYELARNLRADRLTSHIPIIMLTAKAAEEEKLEGLETGVDAYLIKPFSTKELQVRVRKLIEMRRKLRQQTGTKAVLAPSTIEATSMDQEFLQRVREIIEENIGDEDFSVDDLAAKCGMGKRQLQRKLKALTDASPQQCIRSMRLQRAKQLLEQQAGTVSEIAFQVGYGNVAAFSQAFRAEFGKAPSAMYSDEKNKQAS